MRWLKSRHVQRKYIHVLNTTIQITLCMHGFIMAFSACKPKACHSQTDNEYQTCVTDSTDLHSLVWLFKLCNSVRWIKLCNSVRWTSSIFKIRTVELYARIFKGNQFKSKGKICKCRENICLPSQWQLLFNPFTKSELFYHNY